MRARQPNAEERERLRRQRSEMRIILARCKALGGRANIYTEFIVDLLFLMLCRLQLCRQSADTAQGGLRHYHAPRSDASERTLYERLYEEEFTRATRASQSTGLQLRQDYGIYGEL